MKMKREMTKRLTKNSLRIRLMKMARKSSTPCRRDQTKTKMKPKEWFAARPVCTDELDTRAEEAYRAFLGFAPVVGFAASGALKDPTFRTLAASLASFGIANQFAARVAEGVMR